MQNAETAPKEMGIEYQIEKVTQINEIMKIGVMMTPAPALLPAGPALSLPSMILLRSIMGTNKSVVYVSRVIVMSTIVGMLFGVFF